MKLYQIRFKLAEKDADGRNGGTLLVEALTTEEAVKRAYSYFEECIGIGGEILATSVSKVTEVFILQCDEQLHIVKSNYKTTSTSGRVKATPIYQLYMGNIDMVRAKHKELFDGLANEFELQTISRTNIYDIYLYEAQ